MTGKEYADKEYEDLNEGMKGIIAKAFEAGLKQHEHDYLVKTKKIRNEYEAHIEKMKSDVRGNVKWADQNKNEQMYCKLNAMINQWEIKEND